MAPDMKAFIIEEILISYFDASIYSILLHYLQKPSHNCGLATWPSVQWAMATEAALLSGGLVGKRSADASYGL